MKHLNKISKFVLIGLFGILLANCQKDDSLNENQLKSASIVKTASTTNGLQNLVVKITSMVNDGTLSKGEGQSLISKISNAQKSIDKGNTNAVSGQLGALITEIGSFVADGTITLEQGQLITNVAEYVIDFPLGSFVDPRDGQKYSVILIGDQMWMAENLRATKYNDGSDIPFIISNAAWSNLTTPGCCWYNNDETGFKNTYGALYNWYAVNTGKLSPIGWHVATDAEWTTLINYLGGRDIAGAKLKEVGATHWFSPNEGATNESGFNALPGGARNLDGTFDFLGSDGHWWSSSEYDTNNAWLYYLSYNWNGVARIPPNKNYGVSVRCIKD